MNKCPCKDCHDRRLKCHADCAKYLEWAARKRAVHQAERQHRINEGQVMELNSKSVLRTLYGYNLGKWRK